MFQYSFTLAWSDEDKGYIATVPEFPGLSGFGKSPDKAVRKAMEAVQMAIEIMEEDGESIPVPEKLVQASGQIRLRMRKALHRDLIVAAAREGVSLNTYILSLIESNHAKKNLAAEILSEIQKTTAKNDHQHPCPIFENAAQNSTIMLHEDRELKLQHDNSPVESKVISINRRCGVN
jgi:predicted RNase H-like HicB family nuclease